MNSKEVSIDLAADKIKLKGILSLPENASLIVVFAHGSGSGRLSPRNQFVANTLVKAGFATLLLDLLTQEEEKVDDVTRELRFNIPLLAKRLVQVNHWLKAQNETKALKIGYFGASTGAAAALFAAYDDPNQIVSIVSRGGRPDIAEPILDKIHIPVLLIVGGHDYEVIKLNQFAYDRLKGPKELKIIPGATHLFEEKGTLEQVAAIATEWFKGAL